MTRSRLAAAGAVAGVPLLIAALAQAAPSHKADISSAAPKFEWDGGPLLGAVVLGDVDDTLINLTTGGSVTITTKDTSAGDPLADVDLLLYKSNDAGEAQGDAIGESLQAGSDEKITKDLEPGKYLVEVQAFTGLQATYKGTFTLDTSTPPADPGAPGAPTTPGATDQPPTSKISAPGTKARSRSLKVLKGTAADDKGIKRVGIAVVKISGKKCTALTASGSFKKLATCAPTSYLKATGTTAWSFKLKKPLPKGKYALYVLPVDSAGQKAASPAKKGFQVS